MHNFRIENWRKNLFLSFYRSPSQNSDESERLLEHLELNFDHMTGKKPYMMAVLGDFNAKWDSWYANIKTNIERWKIGILKYNFGFNQIINEPTHILNNSSSCIDLIFTSQPNLVTKSGAHSSLHTNCLNQISYVKFNLNVIYPPPYEIEVCHYKQANFDYILISDCIANFD